jgi:hypothetical protein
VKPGVGLHKIAVVIDELFTREDIKDPMHFELASEGAVAHLLHEPAELVTQGFTRVAEGDLEDSAEGPVR